MKAFIVCGAPGAGKSTYGHQLAREVSATLIDIDVVSERLVRLALALSGKDPNDRDSHFFKDKFRTPIYEQMFDIAVDNLFLNHVVIVGPFTRELQDPDWPETLANRLQAEVIVHYVTCDPAIRKKRIQIRGHSRDRGKLKDWEEYLQYYQGENRPCFEHVLIDNNKEKCVKSSVTGKRY
ncbi:ATP-binding protein [uncultured Shewanella sp.]|uniref:AAA family ATPase n=1 Tax=uncultured Shewanella sp. TaxID=173975 RepID=UPI00261839F0|nr:ATP-binding protein [uncultured Shewanella sp.]